MRFSRPLTLACLAAACAPGDPVIDAPLDTDDTEITVDTEPPRPATLGHKSLHRLNRRELDRTLRDLLGVDTTPVAGFPADDLAEIFDNDATVLAVSPVFTDLYVRAIEDVVHTALAVPVTRVPRRYDPEFGETQADEGVLLPDFGWSLRGPSTLTAVYPAPVTSTYGLSVTLSGWRTDSNPLRFELLVNDAVVATFATPGPPRDTPLPFSTEVELTAGTHTLAVRFLDAPGVDALGLPRALDIDHLAIVGPYTASNPLRDRHLSCTPIGWTPDVADGGATDWRPSRELPEPVCTRRVLSEFLRRAWRRTVTAEEIDRLQARVDAERAAGRSWDAAIEHAFQVALLSPHFLFRVEVPSSPGTTVPEPLAPHELASRLSYFLWATMPDETLLQLAEDGSITDPDVLAAQVRRMLASPRRDGFVEGFGDRWTSLTRLGEARPDPDRFPDFDEALRASMGASLRAFLTSFVDTERSVKELLTATSHPVDERLARHYALGVADLDGLEDLPVDQLGRVGLLGHAAWLTGQSKPHRTAPVLRGKWVLKHVLCDEPDAPPMMVPPIDDAALETMSQRELLEAHTNNPVCASCHVKMDAIGFGLEGFDAIGASRTLDGGQVIDTTGALPGGVTFATPAELAALLAEDSAFPACFARHLGSYALGRTLHREDDAIVAPWLEPFAASDHTLASLVQAIVASDAFRTRVGEAE